MQYLTPFENKKFAQTCKSIHEVYPASYEDWIRRRIARRSRLRYAKNRELQDIFRSFRCTISAVDRSVEISRYYIELKHEMIHVLTNIIKNDRIYIKKLDGHIVRSNMRYIENNWEHPIEYRMHSTTRVYTRFTTTGPVNGLQWEYYISDIVKEVEFKLEGICERAESYQLDEFYSQLDDLIDTIFAMLKYSPPLEYATATETFRDYPLVPCPTRWHY